MITEWFKQDIDSLFRGSSRIVVVDPHKQAGFLMDDLMKASHKIYLAETSSDVEELKIKYGIEKNHPDDNVVIYTNRGRDQLRFIRDYCETDGCVDLSNFPDYIAGKLHSELGENADLPAVNLLIHAKRSMGKDENWWRKMIRKLEDIFSDGEILKFLNEPDIFAENLDADIKEIFFQYINTLTGEAGIEKPPATLAKELAENIFTGLAENTIQGRQLSLYHQWSDSVTYRDSIRRYLGEFESLNIVTCWGVHTDHCFPDIDRECFRDLGRNISDKEYCKEKAAFIQRRVASRCSWSVPSWWREVLTLLLFEPVKIDSLKSLDAVSDYYTGEFYTVDTAIRILYAEFLNDRELLAPWQELYENYNHLMLNKWFQYYSGYSQNQRGLLKDLIKKNPGKTAIIVGDGIRFEIARGIAERLKKYYAIKEDYIYADIPSETENNMSALYMSKGMIEKLAQARKDTLLADTGKAIEFMELDKVNHDTKADILVLDCPDIDSLGEKLQQNALKMFSELEKNIADKIQILASVYKHIYLTSDHGFVLTGLLSESDKIEVDFRGDVKKSERYIRSVEKQKVSDQMFEIEKAYAQYNYIYFSKNHRPFKTTGKYGYSHGGITPQELIVPCFCFQTSIEREETLTVSIENKKELSAVVGSTFRIKLAAPVTGSMFAQTRDIQIILLKDSLEYKTSDILTIKAGGTLSGEFDIPSGGSVKVIIIDSRTRMRLDETDIKQIHARDMGGLL